MNEYTEQALSFLRNNNVKLQIKKSEVQQPARWSNDGISGYKYDITMSTSRGAYRFPFWDSIVSRQLDKRPSKYDILACLMVWEGSIDEFVSEFGYEDRKVSDVIETYNAVIDQGIQLKHILDAKAIRALQEIL